MKIVANRFFRVPPLLLSLFLGASAVVASAQTAGFDVGRDFSTAGNPSGVWTFGWAGTVTGAVHPLTVQHNSTADGGVNIPSWQLTHGEAPVVYCNTSGHGVSVASGVVPLAANEVWLASGQDGRPENFAVIQFTAPTNGSYTVATAVRPFYPGPPQGDADFHVVQNNTVLFTQWLSPAQSTAYTNTLELSAGDTIKLLLGRGADGTEYGSVYRLAALINPGAGSTNPPPPPPPPPPIVSHYDYDVGRDFSSVNNPNGVWTLGWATTVGGTVTPLGVRHTSPTESGVLVPSWQLTAGQAPVVYANTSSVPVVFGGGAVHLPSGAVWFAPGQDGRPENFAVIQFTAPVSSNYLVHASVQPIYPAWPQGDTDFHVVRNSEELFGIYLAPTQSASFSNVVALAEGERLQFVVGRGADGSEYGSVLRIAALITPVGDGPTVITNPPPVAPSIVTQPLPYQSVTPGQAAHLSVLAWGPGLLSYQWLFQDVPLAGAESSSLIISNLQPASAGPYRVVVSSAYGAVTSQVAVVNISSNVAGAGTVFFANSSTNRVYDVDGTNFITAASQLVVGLFAGGTAGDLHLVEPVTSFLPVPGRFNGGTRTIPASLAGQTVWMQVKVWDRAFGNTYEEALLAGGKSGASSLFQVRLGGAIIPPPSLNAMPGFALSLPGSPAPFVAASLAVPPTPVVLRRLMPTEEGWTLTLTGPVSATCAIETSPDLITWSTVAYVVNESGVVDYTDRDRGAGRKFYRVRMVNP